MSSIEKAKRIVAGLTAEYRRKLRHHVDECLRAAIKFDETRRSEYFVEMKSSIKKFMETLEQLEKEV